MKTSMTPAVIAAITLLASQEVSNDLKVTSSTPVKDYTVLTVSTRESRECGYIGYYILQRLLHIAEGYALTIWIETDLENGGTYAMIA